MPDMNDPLLKRIAKGATVSVPKLPDTVLTTSISQRRPQITLRLVFASTSIAAALVIGLVWLG